MFLKLVFSSSTPKRSSPPLSRCRSSSNSSSSSSRTGPTRTRTNPHNFFSFFFFSGSPFHPLGSVVVVVVVVVESSVTLPHSRTRALTGRFEVDLTQWSRQSFQPRRRRRRRCFHHHRRRLAATAAVQMEVLYSPFSPLFYFSFFKFFSLLDSVFKTNACFYKNVLSIGLQKVDGLRGWQ